MNSKGTLEVRALSKSFGNLRALESVECAFLPGEIHAVVGENGAGKSTLMNILNGEVAPDAGEIILDGMPRVWRSPLEARSAGIAMVHQHFKLVPAFSVIENLALSTGDIPNPDLRNRATELAAGQGWQVDLDARTMDLSVGQQQQVEILKLLLAQPQVLILDEPTAVLSAEEVEALFGSLRAMAQAGRTVILIAHKLKEVLSVADRVTVLRRGRWILTKPTADLTEASLAEAMVGEKIQGSAPDSRSHGPVLLSVENARVLGDRGEVRVEGVTFEVRGGEIYGIGGVDGNGQIELAEAITGLRPLVSGRVTREGQISLIPQDRRRSGLAENMSIEDNLLCGVMGKADIGAGILLRRSKIREWASAQIVHFRVKIGSLLDPVSSLSGGNQQKVIIARVMNQNPDILVAMNPTRGLDFASTSFVHEQLKGLAAQGKAVVLLSTDMDELTGLCDQVQLMESGRFWA